MRKERDPRKMPTQERALLTVDSILTAIEQLSREEGVEELNVSRVAKRAGVTLGTFYQYFQGLRSALAAWEERELARDTERGLALIADLLVRRPTYEEAIRELVDYCMDFFAKRRAFFRSPAGADFMSRHIERIRLGDMAIQAVTNALTAAPDQGRLRATNFADMARLAMKTTCYVAFDTAGGRLDDEATERVRRELVKMLQLYFLKEPDLGP
jgi:AcrR family transcriptional regulator